MDLRRVTEARARDLFIAAGGRPAPNGPDGYAGHQHQRVDAYIEVQLWCHEPVLAHLTSS